MRRSPFGEQPASAGSVWKRLTELEELAPGATTVVAAGATSLLVLRLGSELMAYHDHCAQCGRSLRGAAVSDRVGAAAGEVVLRCPACHVLYDVRRDGTCLDDAASQLIPVPVLVEGGIPYVAP